MAADGRVTIALTGDVMLGRGIDQVLPYPGDPTLYEPHASSASDYVALAERAHGPINPPVPLAYPWGDALNAVARANARIVNLETAVTRRGTAVPKGINYRVTPENLATLKVAKIDCAVLSNNHVLDWGEKGLLDTLESLDALGIPHAGAGRSDTEAVAPAVLPLPDGRRLLVYGLACASSGVPHDWAAGAGRPGVNFVDRPSETSADAIGEKILKAKRAGDFVVVSVHWGGNWGYEVPAAQRRFAGRLIDCGAAHMVHGHSSHHAKAVELRGGGVILYGCGDFINDYEGISGYEEYRADLSCLYLVSFAPDGCLLELKIVPFLMRRFRLGRAGAEDTRWLRDVMARECAPFGGVVDLGEGPDLRVLPAETAVGPTCDAPT